MSSALPCSSHQKYVWTFMNVVVYFISGRAGHRRVFDGVLPVTCSWISWFCLALLDSFCSYCTCTRERNEMQWEHVDRRIHGWDSYIHLHPVAKAARWCNRLERQSRRVKQQVGSSGHRIWHHKLGWFGRLFGSIGSIWQSSRWFGILWEPGVPGGWEEISGEISILFRDISGFIDNLLILIPHIV